MKDVKSKISNVLEADFEVPYIFKQILKKEASLLPDEKIEDLIFLGRDYRQELNESPVQYPSKLLVLTSYGLIIAEEGFMKISDDITGYRIKHIPYKKITEIELDICLLLGVLRISTNSYGREESSIEFNTARFYRDFELFVESLRSKIFKN
jgi:hypothetical protein